METSASVTRDNNSQASTPSSVVSICRQFVVLGTALPFETLLSVLDDVGEGKCERSKNAQRAAHAIRMLLDQSVSEKTCECEAEKARNCTKQFAC